MSKTNSGLVSYCAAQVGKPYWYGTYGQTASESLYTSKKSQYPSYYTATDYASQYGKRVHDCAGLIKGYLWSTSATSTPTYKASQDLSAKGMYSAATTKGKISTFPKKAGQLVFKGSSTSSISHVGVYDGSGYVYEAKGHAYGVRKTLYSSSDWTYWAQHPDITDDSSDSTTSAESSTTSSNSTSTSASTSSVTASAKAQSYDADLAGTYKVTASSGLNIRDGAGTGRTKLGAIPYGTKVKNYGYYTAVGSDKWLYIQVTYASVTYTGFASGQYLSKV